MASEYPWVKYGLTEEQYEEALYDVRNDPEYYRGLDDVDSDDAKCDTEGVEEDDSDASDK